MKTKGELSKKDLQNLPPLTEVLMKYMTPGTLLKLPEEVIEFKGNNLSPVKSLKVTISSTEAQNQAILHKLHSIVRQTS